MPLTPFHFGPGILVKSAVPKKFSLATFIGVQISIDTETLTNILSGQERLHTFFHSYLGSTIASTSVALAFFAYYKIKHYLINEELSTLSRKVIVTSALIGGWSHVLFDSIMHADLQPWWPWSERNKMLQFVSIERLHLFCIFTGLLGMVLWTLRSNFHKCLILKRKWRGGLNSTPNKNEDLAAKQKKKRNC